MRMLFVFAVVAYAYPGILPPPDLARRIREADTVVVATVRSGKTVSSGGQIRSDIVLHVERVLKGSAVPGSDIAAALSGRGSFLYPKTVVTPVQPLRGIWYLNSASGVFRVLPRAADFGDLYFAATWLPSGSSPEMAGSTPEESVRNEIVTALRCCAKAGDVFNLAAELATLPPDVVRHAYHQISAEQSPELRAAGIAGLITLNDPEGPKRAAVQVESLGAEAGPIAIALIGYHNADDAAGVLAVARLAEVDTAVPMLKANAAYALRRVHTRESVPAMIRLLDSQDPSARAHALAGLCLFVRNAPTVSPEAVPTMSWMESREPAPYRNAETDRYCWMGGSPDEAAKLTGHFAFWKSWWAEHGGEFGAERVAPAYAPGRAPATRDRDTVEVTVHLHRSTPVAPLTRNENQFIIGIGRTYYGASSGSPPPRGVF